ncbi:hypothetical protein SAPIO_CDS2214 [Scedosporium apiospermum]|uniref:Dienelactone hydrolase domain-containing protein n=1 Tax=Pseudallescheria apiosperma TaxID=563466 RepID=A0A084GDH0_PSEDA|nr:uncharacterized protein SAPIO_CDS2214 [Scedosporium apiospermum]KEZ45382.1 hypothetical protein SAPIO_CDS2214 [Scedosporium apiospermum]
MNSHAPIRNSALWLSSFDKPLELVYLPVPEATAGSVVVKVLNTVVFPYAEDIHQGRLPVFNLTLPLVPHPSHIGRVHAVGPDAVLTKPGDLVFFSAPISARDDPDVGIIQGHHGGEGSRGIKLMQGEWRDGSLQQYQKVPLENVFILNEDRLCNQFGYTPADLHEISFYTISAGALCEAAELRAGETIIVGPATGTFGGITSDLALALGANVIAIGRNKDSLERLAKQLEHHERFSYVVMTGDDEADAAAIRKASPDGRGAEVYNDWASGALTGSPYFSAAIRANLKIIGKVIVSRFGIDLTIKMVQSGVLKLGKRGGSTHKVYSLEDHHEAFHQAKTNGFRVYTNIAPNPWWGPGIRGGAVDGYVELGYVELPPGAAKNAGFAFELFQLAFSRIEMACVDCYRGHDHPGPASGREIKLHGYDVYVTEPQAEGRTAKELIVVLSDIFGWNTTNLRRLADSYAERTGCKVYIPDFMHGTAAPPSIKKVIDRILNERGLWGWLVKPWLVLKALVVFLPCTIRNNVEKRYPGIRNFLDDLRCNEGANSKIGVVGFCWGAYSATRLAHGDLARNGKTLIDAAYTAHPSKIKVPQDIEEIRLPYSMCIGDIDFAMPLPKVQQAARW